ncbi:EamA family transporter [Comamonas jiangduensis]|uniref:EamA family transporter n=1 Tax=Comamonas jiangduensis TaxID=1194168 RepID=UPI0028AA6D7B|nr:EamA family transporter [Comamonas jiangduensis]
MRNNSKGLSGADWVLALVVIVVWGVNFVVMKWGLEEVSPLLLCALRFMAASLPFMWFVRRPASLTWGLLAAYGLVQGVGQFGLLFVGMQLGMPAGMASVVLQTQAFITLLMAAALLGERPQPWQWAGLCIAVGGLIVIGSAHGDGATHMTLIGFVCTVASAAMWAASNLITRHAAKNGPYEPVPFLVWSSLFPVLPLLLLSVWLEGGWAVTLQQLQAITVQGLGAVAYLALLSTLLGYGLWTKLLQRYPTSTVAPLSLLVPVVGLLSAMLLLGEFPTLLQWLGTAGVLLGMVVNQFGGRWHRA